ncbi:MAG: C-terminal binding protein [Verrucomicrobia bacterium]|nr:C-terminal binding protein [Verrucomicrobiota bacterium]
MKLCYLNPPYQDLSTEHQPLRDAGIELVPCAVHGEEEVIRAARDADAILTVTDPITARVAEALESCKVIVRLGVGYDVIDVAACRRRGILVCNVPDYGTEEVANHALALCFAVHRRIRAYDGNVRSGRWGHALPWPIHRLSTLRAGVLGLGRIGTAFAKGIQPFVREVVAFDPFLSAEQFQTKGVTQAALPEIFETCDLISLHLPLSKENHHLISEAAIAQMKRKPILINVSRGGLIDSPALIRALQSGQVSGAGLDVFESEPDVPAELLALENVVLSPHVAWYSVEADLQLRRSAIEEIVRVLRGQPPRNPVH